MRKITSFQKKYSTEVIDGELGSFVSKLCARDYTSVVIFYDRSLGKTIKRIKKNKKLIFIPVKADEKAKQFASVGYYVDQLLKKNVDRKSVFLAVGGGVVGDLVGFISAIYMRGVDFVSVPTTLLAMIDSGVGGKNGVNFKKYKNLIGQIKQPSHVLIDIRFLETLPSREFLSGWGELIKYSFLTNNISHEFSVDLRVIEKNIKTCIDYKLKLVKKDEEDVLGVRQLLNLGHTFGHALESYTQYRKYRHGEAIVWGLKFMLLVSRELKLMSEKDFSKLLGFLNLPGVPTLPSKLNAKKIYRLALKDKKSENNSIKMVLLKGRGKALAKISVDEEVFLKCVKYL